MAVEEIKKAISQKVENQVQQIRRRAELVAKREEEIARRRLKDWIEEAEKKFIREKLELIALSRAGLNRRIQLLENEMHDKIWQDFWQVCCQGFSEIRGISGYKDWIKMLWESVASDEKIPFSRIRCNPADVDFIAELCHNMEVTEDSNIEAGFILENEDGKMRLDMTIRTIAENKKQYIKGMFWRYLKDKVMEMEVS